MANLTDLKLPREETACTECKRILLPVKRYFRLLSSQGLPYVCRGCLEARPAPPMKLGKLGYCN